MLKDDNLETLIIMNDKLVNSRISFEKLGDVYEKSKNVTINREIIQNANCYWFKPEKEINTNKLLIYLHGGCFVLGSVKSHQSLVSHLSEHLALPILFIEYGLAPEKPFPSAIDDIENVYKQALSEYHDYKIIFMGDSAGAGLAISVLSRLTKKGIKLPANLVMLSPWIDLTCQNNSFIENKDHDPILTKKALQNYTSMYVGNAKLSDANPIESIKGRFPPTLILVGSGEILLDDSKSIYNKIADHQKKAKLTIYENQNHVWMLENVHSEESKKTIREIKEFIAC
jgi:epsilon-lactone hydrolase